MSRVGINVPNAPFYPNPTNNFEVSNPWYAAEEKVQLDGHNIPTDTQATPEVTTQHEIYAHNKRAIQQAIVDEHNKRAIAFFNSQKVETSTRNATWNRRK